MNLLRSKNEYSKWKGVLVLLLLMLPGLLYAGWESYTQLTSPADGDIITVQDVSVTGVGDGSGKISHLTLTNLATYIKTKIGSFAGAGTSALVPDPTTDDGRLLDTGGWTNTVPVDISGYGPSMAVYSDSSGKIETHPTISSQELAQLDGYNVAAGTVEERFGALAAGEMTLAITIGGEISNEIAATLQVQKAGVAYSENAMLRTWLSASSGGIPSSAFDGDSGDPWVVSDSTVMQTASANYDETVLTGADGDCVITMAHSDAASPATKYLCAEYKNTVSCGEVTFSADSTPCAANDNLSQTLDEYEWTAVYSSYLSQKIDGSLIPTGTWKVCKVVAVMRRGSTGTNPDVHLEFWTEGTSNAGRNMSTAQVNGDSDSETLSSTSDTTIEFTWTSNNPEITGGTNYFMHRAVETDGEAPAYWIGTQNENSFSDTNFDAFGSGTTDLSGDVYFVIYLESV